MKVTAIIPLPESVESILRDHEKWLDNSTSGKQADLSNLNLTRMNFSRRDMRKVNLSGSTLWGADFTDTKLNEADLCDTVLKYTILRGANLSGAKGIESQIDFISSFQKTPKGIIVYKYFGRNEMDLPLHGEVRPGAIIKETVNPDRGCLASSSGIYVASLEWVKGYVTWLHQQNSWIGIWRCLIRWEWLPGIIVPFYSDGEFRTERLELLEEVSILEVDQAKTKYVMYNDLLPEDIYRWY